MTQQLVIKSPGKMMIAGEFAVLEPYQKALVTAIDRFVYATLEISDENKISLPDFDLIDIKWAWQKSELHFPITDARLNFVMDAMWTVFSYLGEEGVVLRPVHLTVRSELADKSGVKYGLGSSAAVVSAVVEVLLQFFLKSIPDRRLVFKLAAIAHVRTQGSGSGADIAASVYGGLLSYTSFHAHWLLQQMDQNMSIAHLAKIEWKYLSIESLPIPNFVRFLVGWTKKAASTKILVGRMQEMKYHNAKKYAQFLKQSDEAVLEIITGIRNQDESTLFAGVKRNRQALREIGNITNVPIETKALAALSNCTESLLGAGKLSGAGGGDCGIAFIPFQRDVDVLRACWKENNVIPLNLQMYEK